MPQSEVFGQAPTAGAMVDIGSDVSYLVSLGIEQVEVLPTKVMAPYQGGKQT